ncbi:MAG: retropepsin-like aspartic protease, partial [Phycisphaerae bacterium]
MHRWNRLPVIDATINGKGPFRLIVDTGAAGLVLKSELVRKLELPDPPGFPSGAAMVQLQTPGGPVSGSLGYVLSLEVGDARLQGIWTVGVDMPFGDEVDGVVGMNVFTECLLTYDYPRNRIQLSQGALPNANGRDILSFSSSGSPSSHPIIELEIDRKATPFMIDTGFGGWFRMPAERVEQLKIVEGPVAGTKSNSVG